MIQSVSCAGCTFSSAASCTTTLRASNTFRLSASFSRILLARSNVIRGDWAIGSFSFSSFVTVICTGSSRPPTSTEPYSFLAPVLGTIRWKWKGSFMMFRVTVNFLSLYSRPFNSVFGKPSAVVSLPSSLPSLSVTFTSHGASSSAPGSRTLIFQLLANPVSPAGAAAADHSRPASTAQKIRIGGTTFRMREMVRHRTALVVDNLQTLRRAAICGRRAPADNRIRLMPLAQK